MRRGVPTLLALLVYGFGLGVPRPLRPGPRLTAADRRGALRRAGGLRASASRRSCSSSTRARTRCRTPASTCSRAWTTSRLEGFAQPDTYSALVELASPVARDAGEGVAALRALRARVRAAGGTRIGAGIHPDGAFGDVEHVDEPRYDRIVAQLAGLIRRTPTCALHVHVGMPDAATAIRVFNGLREHLPLLQALAANSPFWHGRDSGLATARAQLFRGYPRAEIPRAFASYDDYAESVAGVVAAGDLPDYTFLWWDIRPHPRLGTVEVRAMDSQSALWSAAGLAALVHGLARAEAPSRRDAWTPREVLMEASFTRRARRAARAAAAWTARCGRRPRSRAPRWSARRPHAAELGSAARWRESSASSPRATAPTASAPPTPAAGCRRCSSCSWRRPRRPTGRRRRCRRS